VKGNPAVNLSIIIPSRNDRNLGACVGAIRAAGETCRIIVVDDFDGPTRFLSPEQEPVDWLMGVKPFIFSRNINIGIRAARDDDVLLLNDDALLKPACGISAMHVVTSLCPEFGIVSAAVIGPSNSQEHQPGKGLGIRPIRGLMIPFVAVLIPRRTIDAVGLLEERFAGEIDGERVYGGEDDDYCYRVRQAGLKIGIFDGCVVEHGGLQSTFRPDGRGLPIHATRKRFCEIHGFEMGAK
jgi:GT2 family glycosyltransferase